VRNPEIVRPSLPLFGIHENPLYVEVQSAKGTLFPQTWLFRVRLPHRASTVWSASGVSRLWCANWLDGDPLLVVSE